MAWSIRQIEELNAAVEKFSSRVWKDYHRSQHHPPADYQSRRCAFVAQDDSGKLIGVASGKIKAGVGHLSELLVDTGYRSQGVGSALLEAFEERCNAGHCHKLTVHTEQDGPARSFYERRGWVLEATYRHDMAGLDYLRLVKFLDENTGAQKGALAR